MKCVKKRRRVNWKSVCAMLEKQKDAIITSISGKCVAPRPSRPHVAVKKKITVAAGKF